MERYKIIRFREDDRPNETIMRGLTLEEAQAHCRREDTHGPGFFDGYEQDNDEGKLRSARWRAGQT